MTLTLSPSPKTLTLSPSPCPTLVADIQQLILGCKSRNMLSEQFFINNNSYFSVYYKLTNCVMIEIMCRNIGYTYQTIPPPPPPPLLPPPPPVIIPTKPQLNLDSLYSNIYIYLTFSHTLYLRIWRRRLWLSSIGPFHISVKKSMCPRWKVYCPDKVFIKKCSLACFIDVIKMQYSLLVSAVYHYLF